MSSNNDGFFAVDKKKIAAAIALGMNPAISYLVIAVGSGKSNSESSWSVNAIETYTGISRSRAKKAVQCLIKNRIITQIKTGTAPKYRILSGRNSGKMDAQKTIWLPNSLVVGVADETAPFERIRQSQDTMLLTLFIDLYSEQNLIEDGGISRDVYLNVYEKELLNERGQFNVFGFEYENSYTTWGVEVVEKHRNPNPEIAPRDYFARISTLIALGVVERVAHLVDNAEDGEIIHELGADMSRITAQASMTLLENYIHDYENPDYHGYDYMLPIERHLKGATVIGTLRTVYKPRTSMTGGWHQDKLHRDALFQEKYQRISGGEFRNLSLAKAG